MDHKELQKLIKELLNYDPLTGVFTWKVNRGGIRAGTIAGGQYKTGDKLCINITINNKAYLAHRLAWLYETGDYPNQVTHCNEDGTNNSFFNLQTSISRKWLKYTEVKGIMFNAATKKFNCRIRTSEGTTKTATYDTFIDAVDWYIFNQPECGHTTRLF